MSTYIKNYASKHKLKLIDAKQNLYIVVNKKDVKARIKDPENCAMSKACRRVVPGVRAAHFFRGTAWLEYRNKLVRYRLPNKVQKEIVVFDRGGDFEPGEYYLMAPSKSETMQSKRKQQAKFLKKSKGKNINNGSRIVFMTTNIRSAKRLER